MWLKVLPFGFFHLFIGLGQIGNQLRGNLTVCPNDGQLASEAQLCRDSNHCLRNFYVQNCSSGNVVELRHIM